MGLLDGGRAIVTGGGSGIGRATCRRMAEEGARVAVFDVDEESARIVAGEIGGIAVGVDVGDPDALREAVDAAAAELGGLSIMYNNAGTSAFNKLHEMNLSDWDRVLRVNLTGVWAGIRAAVPHLLAGGGGSIVSTASISGTRPAAGESPYAASKAAVAALTASGGLGRPPFITAPSPPSCATSGQRDPRWPGGPSRPSRQRSAASTRRSERSSAECTPARSPAIPASRPRTALTPWSGPKTAMAAGGSPRRAGSTSKAWVR